MKVLGEIAGQRVHVIGQIRGFNVGFPKKILEVTIGFRGGVDVHDTLRP